MTKLDRDEAPWETPSLDWIHRIRRERQAQRKGQPIRPLSRQEVEELSQQFGLKLVPPAITRR